MSALGSTTEAGIAIVGGGAAGLIAGIFAAESEAPLVLEASKDCGLKIVISGGGRCNILPMQSEDSDFYTSGSRHVVERLFRTWRLDQIRTFFEEKLSIGLMAEEETGKLFPVSQRARLVRDRLKTEVQSRGGRILTGFRVEDIRRKEAGGFVLRGATGEIVEAARVILATGGQSVPNTGSDGTGYRIARSLGHTILPPYPALVPLTTNENALQELSGIAVPVRWSARVKDRVVESRIRELLITHRGFSGPAILDASHWFARDEAIIEVSWGAISEDEWAELFSKRQAKDASAVVAERLPRRLSHFLCSSVSGIEGTRIGNIRRERRKVLFRALCAFPLPISGDEGFRVAEVTGGGVPLAEVNPSTLESRCAPGLYLCGEILDVIGRIGGYNFLWAWVTGRVTGQSASTTSTRPR